MTWGRFAYTSRFLKQRQLFCRQATRAVHHNESLPVMGSIRLYTQAVSSDSVNCCASKQPGSLVARGARRLSSSEENKGLRGTKGSLGVPIRGGRGTPCPGTAGVWRLSGPQRSQTLFIASPPTQLLHCPTVEKEILLPFL